MVKWSLILCVYVCIVIRANAKEVMVFISSFKKKKKTQQLPKFNLLAIWQNLIKLEF